MTGPQAAIYGVVQGLTEFLPVSSSGHLVFFQRILGLEYPGVTFEVAVHVGTLLAVLWMYWDDALKIVAGFLENCRLLAIGGVTWREALEDSRFCMALNIAVASLVTGIVTLLLMDVAKGAYANLRVVAGAWMATGVVLFLTRGRSPEGALPTVKTVLVVGLLQAVAVIPGISRSGMTIAAGLWGGLARKEAARFSFLLSIPAILGAVIIDLPEASWIMSEVGALQDISLAVISAAAAGYLALRFVIRSVKRDVFHYFAPYLWIMGIGVWIWS